MRVVSGAGIRAALNEVKPTHIAVAYLGADWREYLNGRLPHEIIISPTVGTNPRALAEIGEAIGWDRVHLLVDLHAKIYIGEGGALIGSCNLTANGLHGELLEEVAVLLLPNEAGRAPRDEFARLAEKAKASFPTVEDKVAAVQALERLWAKAISERIMAPQAATIPKRTITDYVMANDDFYVAWHTADDSLELNDAVVHETLAAGSPESADSMIETSLSFLETDTIVEGRWILCWRAKPNGLADRRCQPYWMMAHHVIPNGAVNSEYTKVVICRADRDIPAAPFYIGDKRFISALHRVLDQPEYAAFRFEADTPWSLMPTLPLFRRFIGDIKRFAL